MHVQIFAQHAAKKSSTRTTVCTVWSVPWRQQAEQPSKGLVGGTLANSVKTDHAIWLSIRAAKSVLRELGIALHLELGITLQYTPWWSLPLPL